MQQDSTMERKEYTPSEHHTDTKDIDVVAHDREVSAEPKGDAVFGVQGTGDVHYTVMGWKKTTVVLLKTQIALGVLGMPTVLLNVGAVPGVFIIATICGIGGYTGYVCGKFKMNHPEVYSVSDVGYIVAGKFGREFAGAGYILFQICLTGTALVPVAIAFETLSEHATCNVVWYVIAMLVTFSFGSIQTLGKVSWLTTIGFVSIMASIITVSIAVGVTDRPAAAPQEGPWDKGISAFRSATFLQAISALATAVFGVCGHPMYFSTISEMARPKEFTKALVICYSIMTATYLTIGIVVYYYAGQYLSSPALGSAGFLMQKVSYGVALPGLFASALLYCHFGAKMLFVRALRHSRHLTAHTKTHWAVWIGSVAFCALMGFILAESVPFFGALSIIIAAFFGTFFMTTGPSICWFKDNWKRRYTNPTTKFWLMVAFNGFIAASGLFIQVAGTYTGVQAIIDYYAAPSSGGPFAC